MNSSAACSSRKYNCCCCYMSQLINPCFLHVRQCVIGRNSCVIDIRKWRVNPHGQRASSSKWQGLPSSYNWSRSSSVVVSLEKVWLIANLNVFNMSYSYRSPNYVAHARGKQHTHINYTLILCLSCTSEHLSLQSLELSCSMAGNTWLARMWRWPLGTLLKWTVGNSQDPRPLQQSGTTHKANWCRGTAGMRWIKIILVVVG